MRDLIINEATEYTQPKPATEATRAANAKVKETLDQFDRQIFEDALRGYIAPLDNEGVVLNERGETVWDDREFSFLKERDDAPDTVNPTLWKQSQLHLHSGLFKVADRIYQVRSSDISNLAIIEGDTGIIVIDPLAAAESAVACLELYFKHRPRKEIKAVVISHSHFDHYAGLAYLLNEDDVRSGKTRIIVPEHFVEEFTSENLFAGVPMTRRAKYMYGALLPRGEQGHVSIGIAPGVPAAGTVTFMMPTDYITHTGQVITIDGLDFEFMLTPAAEAPVHMQWYIPQLKALTCADNHMSCLHNIYTPRGAKIRNSLMWSKYLHDTIVRWGDKTEVLYGTHHWPVWGKERVKSHLALARDAYRFINDETLRLAAHGYTPNEIANMMEFPEAIQKHWGMLPHYGTLYHNVKGTYVYYLGWFDGNPANLHSLSPSDAGRRYVEFMGGADEVLRKARKAFDEGDYRFVSEVLNHLVFADPANKEARELQADSLEQMGYQAPSAPWRNFYLTGAKELREGVRPIPVVGGFSNVLANTTATLMADYLAIRINAPKADGKTITLNVTIEDTGEKLALYLANGVLNQTEGVHDERADASIRMKRYDFGLLVFGGKSLEEASAAGEISVDGNAGAVADLLALTDAFDMWFNIVEP